MMKRCLDNIPPAVFQHHVSFGLMRKIELE